MSESWATSAQLRTLNKVICDKIQLLQLELSLAAMVQNINKLNTQELKVILPPGPELQQIVALVLYGLSLGVRVWGHESGRASCVTLGNQLNLSEPQNP